MIPHPKSLIQNPKSARLLAALGAGLLRALSLTLRLRFIDKGSVFQNTPGTPVIMCFWHNRILGIALAFLRRYPPRRAGVTVLTSPSRDGEILAGVMGRLGMNSVRGSSSRRGSQALLELIRLVKDGADIAITPDGPRGPRYNLGPGAIHLAQTTGAPILPVHASYTRAIRMKTWDGFIIPLPFSKVTVTVDDPVPVPADLDDPAFETFRARIESHLRVAADDA